MKKGIFLSRESFTMKKLEELNEMKDPGGAILKLVSKGLEAKKIAMSLSTLKPGERVAHHLHERAEEIYLLIQGKSRVHIYDEAFNVEAFTAFCFPPQTMHSVINNSENDAMWIFIGAPATEFKYEDLTRTSK